MTLHILARISARPAHRAEVEAVLRGMVAASRAEPGNLRYDLFVDAAEPALFHLVEAWRDAAAVDAHRAAPHYQAYRAATAGWLAAPTVVSVLTGLDVA